VEAERVLLSVRDTGIGIASEHKPRIFERFYRATSAGEDVPAGSGLGLALAKWIADRHATVLLVESEPGSGSCFSFSLHRTAPGLQGDAGFNTPHTELAERAELPASRAAGLASAPAK
jgi:signal transduction histidine kinase